MNIKPIRNEREYDLALGEVDKLWGSKKNTEEGDRLEIWITLIEAYESKRHLIDAPDPITAIEYVLEEKKLKRIELAKYFGSKSLVSDVLNRKKPLTLKMIKALHEHLGIPYQVLIT